MTQAVAPSSDDKGTVSGLRWLVGVDPRNFSAGAVACARRMAQRAPRDRFVAGYVFEESWLTHLGLVSSAIDPDRPAELADSVLSPIANDPTFSTRVWSIERSAGQGLAQLADGHHCDALLIGRSAAADVPQVVRLGRVARRLVRALPRPVVVVPPDAEGEQALGTGPILVGTRLDDTSVGAASFAARLSASLDLDVLVTHVDRHPDRIPHVTHGEHWEAPLDQSRASRSDLLARWVAEQDLHEPRTSVISGSVGPRLLELAHTAGASMIVVGSRQLSLGDRLVFSSVGAELAANARIPVAIVPPNWRSRS